MESNEPITLIILAIFIHLGGWIYAIQIYHTPTEPGWTWSSVGTGSWMIAITEILALVLLYLFDLVMLPSLIIIPIAVLVLIGSPMAILQIYKKWRTNRNIKKIKTEHNFSK